MTEALENLNPIIDLPVEENSEFNEFELGYLLGDGVHCCVWQSVHCASQCPVAVKRIDLIDPKQREEANREMQKLKRLRHPSVTRVYAALYDRRQQQLWLISEFMGGGSALDVMQVRRRPFDERAIRLIVHHVLQGLRYLHGQLRRQHRAVRAANVLFGLTADDRAVAVKLACESTSVQEMTGSQSKRHTVIGAPFWLAPEIIQDTVVSDDESAGLASDVWSLGITCIELAEQEPPYGALSPVRAIFMIPSQPAPKLKRASPQFAQFLALCLVKDPVSRATVARLLDHEFVAAQSALSQASQTSLASAVGEASATVARLGRSAAFGLSSSDDLLSDGPDHHHHAAGAAAAAAAAGAQPSTSSSSTPAAAGAGAGTAGSGAVGGGGGGASKLTSSAGGGGDGQQQQSSAGIDDEVIGDDGAFVDARWRPDFVSFASADELQKLMKLSPEEIRVQLVALEDEKQKQIHRVKQEISKQRRAIELALQRIDK